MARWKIRVLEWILAIADDMHERLAELRVSVLFWVVIPDLPGRSAYARY
jgi:hypothetical protein